MNGREAVHEEDFAGEPVLQASALRLLHRLGGAKLLGEIIDAFLGIAPPLIETALAGATSGNCIAVERSLHSLKSSSGQLGAVRMQRLCSEGEMLAGHGDCSELKPIIYALEAEFALASTHLRAVTATAHPDGIFT